MSTTPTTERRYNLRSSTPATASSTPFTEPPQATATDHSSPEVTQVSHVQETKTIPDTDTVTDADANRNTDPAAHPLCDEPSSPSLPKGPSPLPPRPINFHLRHHAGRFFDTLEPPAVFAAKQADWVDHPGRRELGEPFFPYMPEGVRRVFREAMLKGEGGGGSWANPGYWGQWEGDRLENEARCRMQLQEEEEKAEKEKEKEKREAEGE